MNDDIINSSREHSRPPMQPRSLRTDASDGQSSCVQGGRSADGGQSPCVQGGRSALTIHASSTAHSATTALCDASESTSVITINGLEETSVRLESVTDSSWAPSDATLIDHSSSAGTLAGPLADLAGDTTSEIIRSFRANPPRQFGATKSDSFCDCQRYGGREVCKCGEEDPVHEWVWDAETKSSASNLVDCSKEVKFHVDYSCGTAAVRGTKPLVDDQYYWEVKMTTPVYGTDMMIGVCTTKCDLDRYKHTFCSFLGGDSESWGMSYTGSLHHKGEIRRFSTHFTQGSIVGIHLDMWRGILTFYKNRKLLGEAWTGLGGKTLYPVVASTAARSGMKVIRSQSFKTSLQFMCCQVLRKNIPETVHVSEGMKFPPGLRDFLLNNLNWLLRPCIKEHIKRRMKRCWRQLLRLERASENYGDTASDDETPSSGDDKSEPPAKKTLKLSKEDAA